MDEMDIPLINTSVLEKMSDRIISTEENMLRCINMICSFTVCGILVMRYINEIKLLKNDVILSKYDGLYSSGLLKYLILEILVCGVFYPPYMNIIYSGVMLGSNYVYNLNSIFSIIIMTKIYVVVRIMTYLSRWNTDIARAICNRYNVHLTLKLAFKSEMKKRPAIILTILFMVFMVLMGFALRTFEYGIITHADTRKIKGNNDLNLLSNCFWLILVTMTTVGYGDYYPRSHLGRFIGVLACIIGMLILSMVVVSLSVIIDFTENEKKAYFKLKRIKSFDKVYNKAADILSTVLLLNKMNRSKKKTRDNSLNHKFTLILYLRKALAKFKDDSYLATSHNLHLDDFLKNLENKILTDINNFKTNVKKLGNLEDEINIIEEQNYDFLDRIDEVLKMQESILGYMVELSSEKHDDECENEKEIW